MRVKPGRRSPLVACNHDALQNSRGPSAVGAARILRRRPHSVPGPVFYIYAWNSCSRALVALSTLVAACSPSAEKSNDLVVGPQVTGDGVVLCADGETCGNDPNEMGDSTNVTTSGDGTVVFGSEDVSNGGGIRLSD